MSNYALSKGFVLRNRSLIGKESTYSIEKVLGQGGFGITYLASQVLTIGNVRHKVFYAVKEFFVNKQCWRDEGSPVMKCSPAAKAEVEECRKDFLDEANRLNKICSKNLNIVNVNEVFEANNTAYYVMEYLSGGSLRDRVLGNGAMSEQEALSFLLPVAKAVEYLHNEHRLLHCDISPDNIMLRTDESGMPAPVLIDFGESLHFNSKGDLTTTHTAIGAKEGYAPQEQYQGVKEFDARIDVYALSATLFYLLTGHRPLSAFDMSRDYLEKSLPDGLSPAVRDAIIHGMAKDKKLRTATVADLVSELAIGLHPVATPDELRVGYMLTNGRTVYRVVSVVEKTSAYIHYKAAIGDCGSRGEAGKTKKLASQCNIYEFFAKGVHHRAEEGTLSADGDTSAALQEYLSLCGSKTGNVIFRQFQIHSGPGWATFEANNTYYLVWTKVKKPLPWKRIATYSAGAVGSALLVWGIMTIVRNNIEANERERPFGEVVTPHPKVITPHPNEKVKVTIKLVANESNPMEALVSKYVAANGTRARRDKAEQDIKEKANKLKVSVDGNAVTIKLGDSGFMFDYEWTKGQAHRVNVIYGQNRIGEMDIPVDDSRTEIQIEIPLDWYEAKKEDDEKKNTPTVTITPSTETPRQELSAENVNVDLDGLDFADNNCPATHRGRAILKIHEDLQAGNISRMSASRALSRTQQGFVAAVRKYYNGIPEDKKAGFANELAGLSRNHMTLQLISNRLASLAEKYGYDSSSPGGGGSDNGAATGGREPMP